MFIDILFIMAEKLAKPQTSIGTFFFFFSGTFIETKEQKSLIPTAT